MTERHSDLPPVGGIASVSTYRLACDESREVDPAIHRMPDRPFHLGSILEHLQIAPPTVLDDRGTRVRLLRIGALAGGRDATALEPALLALARRSVWRTIGVAGWFYLALMVAIQLFIIVNGIYGVQHLLTSKFARPGDWKAPALMVLLAPFMIVTMWWGLKHRHAVQLATSFVTEAGCCASCGYALRGLTPERDGCVVCPECASAWRLSADRS